MLLLVAVAVAMFNLLRRHDEPAYAYLEAEVFGTEYGVSGMVQGTPTSVLPQHLATRYNVLGACLCILSAIPLLRRVPLGKWGFLVGMSLRHAALIGLRGDFFHRGRRQLGQHGKAASGGRL